MSPPRRAGREADEVDLTLPGIAQPSDDETTTDAVEVVDADAAVPHPEPDRYTRELPLSEPAPGLGADIVNDVTQIYLNEIGQHSLLGAAEELSLARAMATGDFEARQSLIERNLRLVVSIAKHYTESRPRAARPDRGGQPRPDPRAREIRPRARLPLHDVRDVVDPAVDRARDHEPVAHDPAARARGEGAQRRAARDAPPGDARHARRARADPRRRGAPARQAGRAPARRSPLQRARDFARRADRPRWRRVGRRRRRRRERAGPRAAAAQQRDRGVGRGSGWRS